MNKLLASLFVRSTVMIMPFSPNRDKYARKYPATAATLYAMQETYGFGDEPFPAAPDVAFLGE